MALVDADGNDGKMFFSLFEGILKRNVDKNTDGAKERVNKNGNTVYEKFYRSVSGKLVSIEKKSHEEYGDSWIIELKDGIESYFIQIPYSSRQADGFLRRIPNLELAVDLTIQCGVYDEKPYLTIKQHGDKVEYYWTREEPGKLPEMVKMTVKGKEVWDDTDKMAYLERYVVERLQPKLLELNPVVYEDLPPTDIGTGTAPDKEEDDLPF